VWPYYFLIVALWGLFVATIAVFNPRGWGNGFYRFSKRTSKIGSLKMGIFAFSDDPMIFRVFTTCLGLGLFVGGIAIFVSLV
jgi:hypothetical protein